MLKQTMYLMSKSIWVNVLERWDNYTMCVHEYHFSGINTNGSEFRKSHSQLSKSDMRRIGPDARTWGLAACAVNGVFGCAPIANKHSVFMVDYFHRN